MRVLVSNDDGIGAPGLRLLAQAARVLAADVWVVAPERKWTASSHHVSFDCDLTLARHAPQVHACSGTPVDAIIAAMTILLADHRPDLVLAGVNDKRNVGEDVAYSGTMAIAREATFWHVPAIAFSGDGWGGDPDAQRPAIARILQALWATRSDWATPEHWLAVNLPPSLPAPVRCARVARDKIAGAADVVEATAERIVFRVRRGRPGTFADGDENAALRAGELAVVRHCWRCEADVPPAVVAALRAAAS